MSKQGETLRAPYRATKLWNEAVRSFYNNMPLSRHWRGLRQYENCFTAADAVSWLHTYLISNPSFEPSVTREQALKLMRKFLKCGLIAEAKGNKFYAEDFEDNRELFRFTNQSPLKALRSPGRIPLAPIITNSLTNCGSSPPLKDSKYKKFGAEFCDSQKDLYDEKNENVTTNSENKKIARAWLEAFFERLEIVTHQLMIGGEGSSLLPMASINSTWIQHNMTLLKSKDITRVDRCSSDDPPHWILNAMKCLANWPNSSDSVCNIPNYPGVEIDIFKVVRDFFSSVAIPLIPYSLYDPVIRVYIGAEFLDIAHRTPDCKEEFGKSDTKYTPTQPLSPCDSVEDLILNISLGGSGQPNSTPLPVIQKSVTLSTNGTRENLDKNVNSEMGDKSLSPRNQTPTSFKIRDGFSSIPRSLKLNRLKTYTDFKDSYLYHGSEASNFTKETTRVVHSVESSESISSRVTVKSLKNRSKLASKVSDNCAINKAFNPNFSCERLLKTEELDGFSLPPNSCFETAFTSDSPRTRIIPQKSVDTIHFRSLKDSLRPKSIAVSSFERDEAKSCNDLNELEWLTANEYSQSLSYNEAEYGLNRSLSEGDLLKSPNTLNSQFTRLGLTSLENNQILQKMGNIQKVNSSKSSLAARVRDSIKRKKGKDSIKFPKSSWIGSYQVSPGSDPNILETYNSIPYVNGNDVQENDLSSFCRLKRLRTKSGGYTNPGMSIQSCSSTDICIKPSSTDHFRTDSGGFVNLGLHQSTDSSEDLIDGKLIGSSMFPASHHLDSVSCYSSTLSTHSKSHSPSFHSIPPPNSSPSISRKSCYSRSHSATPNGCLSHSLASSASNSEYHSALSVLNQTSLSAVSSSTTKSLSHSESSQTSGSFLPPELPRRQPIVVLDSSLLASRMTHDCLNGSDVTGESSKPLSASANELSDDWVDRIPFGRVPPFVRGGLWKHYNSSPRLLTKVGKEMCIEALQLITLVLEPSKRRNLNLLLKWMNKVSRNERLQLDNVLPNRALVVQSFSRFLLVSAQETDYDEMLTTRVVTFLMDNHDVIFTPPQHIAVVAHRKINPNDGSKTVPAKLPGVLLHSSTQLPLTYCHQVSPQTYHKQTLTSSHLSKLLDQILENPKIVNKEKRKKLKEFKLLYPEIYNLKFPPGKENELVFHEKRNKLKGLKKFASIKSLTRSKSIRI